MINSTKSFGLIIGLFVTLLLFIFIGAFVINFVIDIDNSLNSNIAIIDIEYTGNNNVLIIHDKGPSIETNDIIINVDNKEAEIEFEKDTFERGDTIVIEETPDGEEFSGGEKIDVLVGEEETNIATKIIPQN